MEDGKVREPEKFATKRELELTEKTLRTLVEQVKTELKSELEVSRLQLKAEIAQAKFELAKWLAQLLLGIAIGVSVALWLFVLLS